MRGDIVCRNPVHTGNFHYRDYVDLNSFSMYLLAAAAAAAIIINYQENSEGKVNSELLIDCKSWSIYKITPTTIWQGIKSSSSLEINRRMSLSLWFFPHQIADGIIEKHNHLLFKVLCKSFRFFFLQTAKCVSKMNWCASKSYSVEFRCTELLNCVLAISPSQGRWYHFDTHAARHK